VSLSDDFAVAHQQQVRLEQVDNNLRGHIPAPIVSYYRLAKATLLYLA
jgi:hypothetical protein